MGQDVKEYFMYINGPKILNMWLGESERIVREIFAQARERAREGYLVFIFIDEAESILRTRSSGRFLNIANTVVPQFAAEMDGLVSLQNVVVMLTSNRPDYIDPAILRPERIDRKVKVTRPDRQASRDILNIYLHPQIPLDPEVLKEHGDREAARNALIDEATAHLFRKNEDTEFLEVYLRNGGVERLYWKDLVSGALLMSVVERAKDFAIKRSIEKQSDQEGLSAEDLRRAIRVEYKENEIFPKTDTQEDWLKLLDYEQENVVNLKPIRPSKSSGTPRRSII
jgi:proteasome-associated ATPase